MRQGKKYILKIRFFDAKGNGEVLIELPFKISSLTRTFPETFTSQSTLGVGISSASVDVGASSIELTLKGKSEVVKSYDITRNAVYSFTLKTSKCPAANSIMGLRFCE